MLRITYWRDINASQIKTVDADLSGEVRELHIGQESECFIVLRDSEYVSRRHATIFMVEDKYLIRDNHSVNGITVNRWGEINKLNGNSMRLLDGDAFAIADYIFIFHIKIPEPAKIGQEETPSVLVEKISANMGSELKNSIVASLLEVIDGALSRIQSARKLRTLIDRSFLSDSDLDAFLIDCFPDIRKRCSTGMDRKLKINLLIELTDRVEIAKAIREYLR